MKIFKKTLILLGILLCISGYYFYEVKTTPKREKKKEEEKKLFSIDKKKINKIYIKNGEKEIEIIKSDGNWIIKDKNYECDKNEIESLINKISSLEVEREIENISDLSQYGLTQPEKIIKLQENGEKYILYIGDETPTGSYLYTTTDNRNVKLVYKWDLDNILKKEIFDLRDKRILPVDIVKSDVDEIEIKKGNYLYYFERSGDEWYIKNKINDLAGKEKMDEILENIFDKKIKEYEENKNEKECGLEKPVATIKIKVKNNEYFLYIGKKKDNLYYAKNSLKPYIFLVEDRILDIPENINELREKKLFDFNLSDVNEITIAKKNEEIKFLKEKDKWYLEKDKTKKVSKGKIENFLSDLKYVEIENFIDYSEDKLKNYSLSPPEIKISVFDNKKKNEIYFGKKTDKEIYCYHPERKILFTIPSSDYDKINKDKEFFIEKGNK